MELKTITKEEEQNYYEELRLNYKENEVVEAKSLFLPLKRNLGIIFGKSEKFEYKKSKTFGLVKVFFKNKSIQYIREENYFDKENKYIKSGIYEKPHYKVSVYCENGFKFDHKIFINNSLEKINEERIKEELKPIFENELKRIKKQKDQKKILRNIDNLILSYQDEEKSFLFEGY